MFFNQKLVQAASLALIAATTNASIVEFKEGDDPSAMMAEYDYCIVSFYNSEDWAIEVDKLMDGAKAHLEKKIADGEWTARPSMGWFRVDIEKHPELNYEEDGMPDTLVVSQKTGLRRYLHYEVVADDQKEEEEHLALIIKELTGDFITPATCEEIQAETRYHYDEVVYFGDKQDIEEHGLVDPLRQLAMVDKY